MDFCRWLAAEANQPTIKTVCKQRLGIKLIAINDIKSSLCTLDDKYNIASNACHNCIASYVFTFFSMIKLSTYVGMCVHLCNVGDNVLQ